MTDENLHNDDDILKTYQGVPLKEIPTLFDQPLNLSDMQDVSNDEHRFLIKPFKYDLSKPDCEPETKNGINEYIDRWDDDHVRMPSSSSNVNRKGTSKWPYIQNILTELKQKCEMNSATTSDLKKAIEHCNETKFDIGSLEYLINKFYSEDERTHFMSVILPHIIYLAINVDKICGEAPQKLRSGSNHSLTLSQRQAAALLSCAFFCLFPSDSDKHANQRYATYQSINFNQLFKWSTPWKVEKLKCFLHYFRRITEDMPKGVITFQRTALSDNMIPQWLQSDAPISKIHMDSKGTIEDMHGLLEVDFANMYIGGGVMDEGRVQEEIRFTICPEMLVSILVCEVMQSNECIFLIGCEQFTTYDGYCDTFQMKDTYVDKTIKDDWGRKRCHVVAIDATYFGNPTAQYGVKSMVRELIKAYVGFRLPKPFEHLKYGIATGNWGCGAFNGDLQLKAIIQLIAASQANRPLVYLTFSNQDLVDSFWCVYQYLVEQKATVGNLCDYLQQFSSRYQPMQLFDFILSIPLPLKTTV